MRKTKSQIENDAEMPPLGLFFNLIQPVKFATVSAFEANIHLDQLVKTHVYFTLYIENTLKEKDTSKMLRWIHFLEKFCKSLLCFGLRISYPSAKN